MCVCVCVCVGVSGAAISPFIKGELSRAAALASLLSMTSLLG